MKNTRVKLLAVLLVVHVFTWIGLDERSSAAMGQEQNVVFRWAFGAITGPTKARKFVTVTRDTILKTGDELKLAIELEKQCYVYLVHQSPQGEIAMLFPYDSKQYTAGYDTGKSYYIPKGQSWFELDKNVGKETFHLLASDVRLMELETLIGRYIVADETKKKELAKAVVSEIVTQRRSHRSYAAAAERPATIGGGVRSYDKDLRVKPDVAQSATEVLANKFYSKTITIDHK
jgi:hypothetical protein